MLKRDPMQTENVTEVKESKNEDRSIWFPAALQLILRRVLELSDKK